MEAFEPTLLDRLGARGIRGSRVFLIEASGAPRDLVVADGRAARATTRSSPSPGCSASRAGSTA